MKNTDVTVMDETFREAVRRSEFSPDVITNFLHYVGWINSLDKMSGSELREPLWIKGYSCIAIPLHPTQIYFTYDKPGNSYMIIQPKTSWIAFKFLC